MQAAREKSSIDEFISNLQDEVNSLGDSIATDLDIVEAHLDEQSTAFAADQRAAMAAKAEVLLNELQRNMPRRPKSDVPRQKTSYLTRGARIVVAGGQNTLGEQLTAGLESMGYEPEFGSSTCPAASADPNLPASSTLRRELAGADALIIVCSGAVSGGGCASATLLAACSRVLPASLRRVLMISPRGTERTFTFPFAFRNALGQLDNQRAAEQRMVAAARAIGAASTIMRVEVRADGGGALAAPPTAQAQVSGVVVPSRRPDSSSSSSGGGGMRGVCIADGDALYGVIDAQRAARAAREALRRPECNDNVFSLAAGDSGDWEDEFKKLVGPEIGRFTTAEAVPADWVRSFASNLLSSGKMLSNFAVFDLPTKQELAACKTLNAIQRLPTGARIHFLASGAEFVGKDEAEERVKGDFDGAIDILVEEAAGMAGVPRVRVVRSQMEAVFRKSIDGGRMEVKPLVKVASEERLLAMLARALEEEFGVVE